MVAGTASVAAGLLAGAAVGALSTAAASAELLSAGNPAVAAGLFAGAAAGLLAIVDVATDFLSAAAGPMGAGLFVDVAAAALSVSSGLPGAAGLFAGIAAGDTGRVAAELVAAGGVVLEGWTGPLFGATRRPGTSFKNASHIGDSSIR